jgi:hypothetical protein
MNKDDKFFSIAEKIFVIILLLTLVISIGIVIAMCLINK